MKKGMFLTLAMLLLPMFIAAQPRPADKTPTDPANIPGAFEARYESGIFGSSNTKQKGTLRFDDANERIVFHRLDGAENIGSKLPVPGAALFNLATTNRKYLIVHYDEQEVDAQGIANFRFDKKQLLLMFIDALGTRAKMVKRGDAYYRGKNKF
jgi:hypothetical protein